MTIDDNSYKILKMLSRCCGRKTEVKTKTVQVNQVETNGSKHWQWWKASEFCWQVESGENPIEFASASVPRSKHDRWVMVITPLLGILRLAILNGIIYILYGMIIIIDPYHRDHEIH